MPLRPLRPQPKNEDQAAALAAGWLSQGKSVQSCSNRLREFGYDQQQVAGILRDAASRLVGPNLLDDVHLFAIQIARADRAVEMAAEGGNPQALVAALKLLNDTMKLPAEHAGLAQKMQPRRP